MCVCVCVCVCVRARGVVGPPRHKSNQQQAKEAKTNKLGRDFPVYSIVLSFYVELLDILALKLKPIILTDPAQSGQEGTCVALLVKY